MDTQAPYKIAQLLRPDTIEANRLAALQRDQQIANVERGRRVADLVGGLRGASAADVANSLAGAGFVDESLKYQQVADTQAARESQEASRRHGLLRQAYGQIAGNPTGENVRRTLGGLGWLPAEQVEQAVAATEAMPAEQRRGHFLSLYDPSLASRQEDAARARAEQATAALERQREAQAARAEQAQMNREMRTDLAQIARAGRGGVADKAPSGYRFTSSGDLEPIPGGPADAKTRAKADAQAGAAVAATSSLDELESAANELKNAPGLAGITGIRGAIPNVPGSQAADAQAKLETLKAKVAFGALQAMRDASKTGGALGSITERELSMLQNSMVPLERAQSFEQFQKALDGVMKFARESKDRIRRASQGETPAGVGGQPAAPSAPKQSVEEWVRGPDGKLRRK